MALASSLFAVPFASFRHPDPGDLNTRLRELFLAREAEGTKHANQTPMVQRNAALYESHFRLFDWPDACVQELKTYCFINLLKFVAELNQYDAAMVGRLEVLNSAWFHITRHGGYFDLHNHPMATWSGVYCVDPGDVDPASPSGALTFISPMASHLMFADNSVVKMARPYSVAPVELILEPGQLVFFPSWLLHQVKTYLGQRERITVAFNTWFRTHPPAG